MSIFINHTTQAVLEEDQLSSLDERLTIHQYRNDLALLEFDYVFQNRDKNDSYAFNGIYPSHFRQLFNVNPELEWFEASLVQGRWNHYFTKLINNFDLTQLSQGTKMEAGENRDDDIALP